MLEIAIIVMPVFLVVFAGYIAARVGLVSGLQTDALMHFTVHVAAPALLFNAVTSLDLGEAMRPTLLSAYYIPIIGMLLLGAFTGRRLFGQRPGEAVAAGFTATFANSLFLGLPIIERAYGGASHQATLALIAVHAPICYLAGGILMESARADGTGALRALKNGIGSLSKNPLVIGVVAGVAWNLLLGPLPVVLADATEMLARAALPVGMFAVGAVLTRYALAGDFRVTAFYVTLTLVIRPMVVFGAAWLLSLEDAALKAVVMLGAMPGGLNIYIFASIYKRSEALAANVLLLSTALGILTVSAWLAILG